MLKLFSIPTLVQIYKINYFCVLCCRSLRSLYLNTVGGLVPRKHCTDHVVAEKRVN